MSDGQIEIGVEIEDEGISSEASKVGKEAGKGIESGIKDGTEKSGGLLETLKGKFSGVFAAMGGIAAGFSLANVAGEIVDTGRQFEASMSNVAALSGANEEQLDALENKAREMGATTTFSASQAADALGYMALAGWDAEQSMEGLPGVLSLAQAGQMDLAEASDLVTDYLSAFGMEADETGRMVDVLAYAQANANTTVEGLGMAFKNAAANAHAAGMDVETTTAAISMMANQGLKGSEAGTALAATLRDMTQKAEDGSIAIGDQSVAISDSEGNFRDFADILADVEAATAGMGEQEKQAALMTTFTADSIRGLNIMLNAGSDELSGFRDELYNSAGAGEQMADVMTDNLEGDIKEFQSALEELQLKIYDSFQQPLRDATQFATNVVVPGVTLLVQNFDKIGPVLATIGVALLAYRKNWDIVATAQNLAAKAVGDGATQFTRYFKIIQSDGTVAFQRFNAATGQYQVTQSKLRATIANSTVGMKAQAVAVNASSAAMSIAGKVASVAGKAMRTVAPVAVISVIMDIAASFKQAADDAKTLEKATSGLGSALDEASGAGKGIESVASSYEQSAREIIDASREAISAQADFADSLGDSFSEVRTNSALVDSYTETINRLAGQSNLTASQQGELTAAVNGLNDVCGTTYTVVDAVNGQLSASTSEINANAEAWKKNAEAQALQEAYQEAVKNRIQQEEQLALSTEKANSAERDFEITLGNVRLIEGFATAEANELAAQRDAQAEATESAAQMEESLKTRMDEATAAAQQSNAATAEGTEAATANAEAVQAQGEAVEEATKAHDELVEKILELAEESNEFAGAMDGAGWSAEDMANALEATGSTADDLASSIDSVQQQTANAFDLIEQKSDISLEKMQENLEANAETTRSWSEDVQTLYDMAGSSIETDFIAYLSSLGPEYASVLDELANSTPEKLTEMASAWSEGMDAGRDGAVTSAQLTTDEVAQVVEEGREKVAAAAEGYGEAMGESVQSGGDQAASAAEANANGVVQSFTGTLDAGKPLVSAATSGLMAEANNAASTAGTAGMTLAGNGAVQTLNDAINAGKPLVNATMTSVATEGAQALTAQAPQYTAAGNQAVSSFNDGENQAKPAAVGTANSVASEVGTALGSASAGASAAGANTIQGFINGANGMRAAVVSSFRSIANSALTSMKSALDIHSPSKRAENEVGKNLALGVAVGVKKNAKTAKKASSDMSKDMVSAAKTKLSDYKKANDLTLKQEQAFWKQIVKQTKRGSEGRAQAEQYYNEAHKKALDQAKKAEEDYQKSVRKIQDQLIEDVQDATDKYLDAVNDRRDAILGGFDLFEAYERQQITSGAELIANMESQARAADDYYWAMQRLEGRIGKGTLYDEIAAKGVDALSEIHALNSMSQAELNRFVSLYNRRNAAAMAEAKAENSDLKKETEATIKSLADAANKEMASASAELKRTAADLGVSVANSFSKMAAGISAAVEKIKGTMSSVGTTAAKSAAAVYDGSGRARGVSVASVQPMALGQTAASIGSGMQNVMVRASSQPVENSTVNETTVNINQPVRTPAEFAREVRMISTYGLAGKR